MTDTARAVRGICVHQYHQAFLWRTETYHIENYQCVVDASAFNHTIPSIQAHGNNHIGQRQQYSNKNNEAMAGSYRVGVVDLPGGNHLYRRVQASSHVVVTQKRYQRSAEVRRDRNNRFTSPDETDPSERSIRTVRARELDILRTTLVISRHGSSDSEAFPPPYLHNPFPFTTNNTSSPTGTVHVGLPVPVVRHCVQERRDAQVKRFSSTVVEIELLLTGVRRYRRKSTASRQCKPVSSCQTPVKIQGPFQNPLTLCPSTSRPSREIGALQNMDFLPSLRLCS
jgi:hypothetical protein